MDHWLLHADFFYQSKSKGNSKQQVFTFTVLHLLEAQSDKWTVAECECGLIVRYLPGTGRWTGRTASTPPPPRSWCRSAGLAVPVSRWADTSPPLRNTQSHITRTTSGDTHTHTELVLTNTVLLVPVELLTWWTHTLVAALRVHAAVLTAAVTDAALVDVWGTRTENVTGSV